MALDVTAAKQARETGRLAIAVVGQYDAQLARLTLDAIALQTRTPDLVLVVAGREQQHVFNSSSLGPVCGRIPVEFIYVAGFRPMPPTFGLLCAAGAGAAAAGADVFVLCPAGLAFDSSYLAHVEQRFQASDHLVGALDIPMVARGLDAKFSSDGASIPLTDATVEKLPRVSLRGVGSRLSVGCALAIRSTASHGLPFSAFTDRPSWIEFSSAVNVLQSRGQTRITRSPAVTHVRFAPNRRSGYEDGERTYRLLPQFGPIDAGSKASVRLELMKLTLEHALNALLNPAERFWSLSFLRGMWDGRRRARVIRKTVERDIADLA